MTALSPQKALQQADAVTGAHIPQFVIETVNAHLKKNLNANGYCRIMQNTLMDEVLKHPDCLRVTGKDNIDDARKYLWANNMMDIEIVFRQKGWNVKYDKPGYCEDYEANWEFKAK